MSGLFQLGRRPLPWLLPHWQRLWRAQRDGRLGHALLLTGPAGTGKRLFADLFSAALKCPGSGDDGVPCGQCHDCTLAAAGHHPDIVRVRPETDSKSPEIKVDAIRALVHGESLTAQGGGRKVIQISPAEAMNVHAANSLLKTLEEPAPSTLLMLLSEDASRLPATVRSRCQRIEVPAPAERDAVPWLEQHLASLPRERARAAPALLLRLAHGAPLRALTLVDSDWLEVREAGLTAFLEVGRGAQDPVAAAAAWQAHEPGLLLEGLVGWVSDVLRLGCDHGAAFLENPDKRDQLRALSDRVSPVAGHRYLQRVLRARAMGETPINKQLLFESLLVQWACVAAGGH